MTIERIREALLAEGWSPHLYDDDTYTLRTPAVRIALSVRAHEDRWVASVVSEVIHKDAGPAPLTALRRLCARCGSHRVRAELRRALMKLREPEADRYDVALALVGALPDSPWLDHVRHVASDLLPRYPDAADRYLSSLDFSGHPPEEIYDAVAALRARLEEMG